MNAIAIALSVPVFFAAIGLEQLMASVRGMRVYRLTDSIGSLSCGVVQQATSIFLKVAVLGAYAALADYEVAGAFFTPDSVLAWVLLMVMVDHQYYWFHRASHRVNVFWATHVVHHQSEEYNLTTALRQSALQGFVSAIFYWPIAMLGVPLSMFVAAITANTLYQFWIHTRMLKKLGPLEWVLNTPSHHRVHHAIDPQYVDKNYGGISIVWDRLYGTFAEERTEPHYGTVKVLGSFNSLWANVDSWAHILKLMRGASTLREKLWAPFAPPEWQPRAMGGTVTIPPVNEKERVLYDVPTSRALRIYVAVQFALVGVLIVLELLLSGDHGALELAALAAWISVSTASWGGLFESKPWAPMLEITRLVLLPVVVHAHANDIATLTRGQLDGMVPVAIAALVAVLSVVHCHIAVRAPRPAGPLHDPRVPAS